ncbi:MAG: HYC_CC_PP family protein, partial [Chitinophagaceae bacterium]
MLKTLYFCTDLKKFFAISLAIVYLAISSGVVLNIHYCMGEIAEVAFGQHKSDKCGQCGMENDGCC